MSKSGATSANLKPCNVDNAELHCNVEHRKELAYVRHDLTSQNVAWHAYDNRTLRQCFDDACELYKSSTGQKPQLGKVERFDIKTKRKRTIEGFAPIREMVVVMKPETTEEDIDNLCKEMQTRFGMTPLAFSMHFDEGHWAKDIDPNTGEITRRWEPNLHAHLYFDVMERRLEDNKGKAIDEKKRGRTIKFTEKQMSLMQDIAAKTLGMERGEKGGQRRTNDDIYEFQRDAQLKELSGLTMQTNEKKSEIGALNGKIAELKTQVEGSEQTLSNLSEEIVQKGTALESLKKDISEKDSELEEKRNAVAELDNDIENKENKKDLIQMDVDYLTDEHSKLDDSIKEKRIKENELGKDIEQLSAVKESKEQTIAVIKELGSKAIDTISGKSKREKEELKKQLRDEKKQHADDVAELKRQHADDVANLKSNHENAITTLNSEHETKLNKIKSELKEEKKEHAKTQKALNKALTDNSQDELKRQLKETRNELATARRNNTADKNKIDDAEKALRLKEMEHEDYMWLIDTCAKHNLPSNVIRPLIEGKEVDAEVHGETRRLKFQRREFYNTTASLWVKIKDIWQDFMSWYRRTAEQLKSRPSVSIADTRKKGFGIG